MICFRSFDDEEQKSNKFHKQRRRRKKVKKDLEDYEKFIDLLARFAPGAGLRVYGWVFEYLPPLHAAINDMIKHPFKVQPSLSGHAESLPYSTKPKQLFNNLGRPLNQ
jgi:hypothetical protein